MTQLEFNNPEFAEKETQFADILLPVPIANFYTYRIPEVFKNMLAPGFRVIVEFGRNKVLTGVVVQIHNKPPESYQAKYILDIPDDHPVIQPIQLEFILWMAEYYMCTQGEVLNAALPSGLKLSSLSMVQLHPEFDLSENGSILNEREFALAEALQNRDTMMYEEISDLLGIKSISPIINSLISKKAILIFEKVIEKYKPKKIKRIRLARIFAEQEDKLEDLFKQLEKRTGQLEILLKYLQEIPIYHQPEKNFLGLEKKVFSQGPFSDSSLKTMIGNGIFEEYEQIVSRFGEKNNPVKLSSPELSAEQQVARDKIYKAFENQDICLLHGITGSGKTEIYIDLILSQLENGKQALLLLPEIALTTQIVKRLLKVFGSQMGVFHSKYSDNERVEIWNGVATGGYNLVVGVRSAVFLPFDNLGLIIVDEEHELSYKQFDPAPRYHARDAATVLAKMHKAKTLLGSATPSLESYHHAKNGKYGLVELNRRFGNAVLPSFTVYDLIEMRRKKKMNGDFSLPLTEAIQKRLDANEQVIIFQNRRGYAPYIACQDCNWIPTCDQCAVSLTYHMYQNMLRCHYCGHKEKPAGTCPACGSTKLQMVGFGTEKLEEDLKSMFTDASIKRMDLDTTRSRYSYQSIINEFEQGTIDILVGTQMISKGLDFDNVTLVGILDIDRMMHYPDFRSMERAFQLVTQVSGRAGRKENPGEVVIQSAHPNHPLISKIINYDYTGLFNEELIERHRFGYPPFVRIIKFTLKHKEKEKTQQAAIRLFKLLVEQLGKKRVFGPAEPVISKIRNHYLMEILVKIERSGVSVVKIKEAIRDTIQQVAIEKDFKSVRIIPDVDCY